jgi:hypothetical protein
MMRTKTTRKEKMTIWLLKKRAMKLKTKNSRKKNPKKTLRKTFEQ